MIRPHFRAIQLWLVVLPFVVDSALREMVRAIGVERVREMFFGNPAIRRA